MEWYLLKKGTTAEYEGERVKILEIANGYAYIWIPSTQSEIAMPFPNKKLKNIRPKPKVIN
jgi:hypothetical protein